jgi:hypothetical protein
MQPGFGTPDPQQSPLFVGIGLSRPSAVGYGGLPNRRFPMQLISPTPDLRSASRNSAALATDASTWVALESSMGGYPTALRSQVPVLAIAWHWRQPKKPPIEPPTAAVGFQSQSARFYEIWLPLAPCSRRFARCQISRLSAGYRTGIPSAALLPASPTTSGTNLSYQASIGPNLDSEVVSR